MASLNRPVLFATSHSGDDAASCRHRERLNGCLLHQIQASMSHSRIDTTEPFCKI